MRMSLSLLILGCLTICLATSPAQAQRSGWGWDRDAGAKIEGRFGDFPGRSDYPYDASSEFYPAYASSAASPYTTGYGNFDASAAGAYGSYPSGCQPMPWSPDMNATKPPSLAGQQTPTESGWRQAGYGRYSIGPNPAAPPQPAAEPDEARTAPVHVGDRIQAADRTASVMLGDRVVATVQKGQVLPVLDIQGPWVGTIARDGDREVRGWIHIDQLAPVSVAATRMR